jgi:hypothetical protein
MRRLRLLRACWALLCGPTLTISICVSQEAFPCPAMPDKVTQVNHDVSVDVKAGVGSLGKLKAGEVGAKTDVVAKNLFDKYPNSDRIIIAQMMAATYCPMIRDSKDLKDSEKRRLWSEFSNRVFKFENPTSSPPSPPKPKGSPPVADKSTLPPTAAQPFVRQECAPGANCAQSNNQQGGFTGQIIIGQQPRITDGSVEKLAAQLSLCDSGSTTAAPQVVNPNGSSEHDAENLAAAFAKTRRWSYSGVGHTTKGQDIGPDGPIPDPTGIHIYSDANHERLANCVKNALHSIGVESVVEPNQSQGASLGILVGNSPN